MKVVISTPLLFAIALLEIPGAYSQSTGCTLTPSAGAVSLSAIGTASSGGVLPEIPRTIAVTATGNCGALTASATVSPTGGGAVCGGSPSFGAIPWLAATASGGDVTFTALSNSSAAVRTGSIVINSASGASATIAVTESATGEDLEFRQVRALYQSILGRDPDAGGFAFWTGIGANGLGYMADGFLTSPEAFNTDFAAIAAYQAATGAPPTYAQFQAAVGPLRAGMQTVAGLFQSLIAANSGYSASNLYQNLLSRYPTFTEALDYEDGPAAAFEALIGFPGASSPVSSANNEFQSTGAFSHGADHTNALYIYMLYFTILDRDPDLGGREFWIGIANSGGPGVLFQGAAGLATRIAILGPGAPGVGFVGSVEFAGSFCPLIP